MSSAFFPPAPSAGLRPRRSLLLGAGVAAAAGATCVGRARAERCDGAHAPSPPSAAERSPRPPPLVQAAAGAVAGGCARVAVAPLDVLKIRFQVQVECAGARKYTGLLQAARLILAEEGARGLWRGTAPALLLWAPYTAVQFAVLEQLNSAWRRAGRDPGKAPASFASGAAASAAATVASYPLDVLRTVMASQGGPGAFPTVRAALDGVVAARGRAALFAGLGVTLAEIIPYGALQFGTYAALKDALGDGDGSSLPGWVRFGCGFAAGSAAKLVLHPLDVVKKRMQVAGLARPPGFGAAVAHARAGACFRAILKAEGVRGLYKGLLPNLLKAAPASGITFVVYEHLVAAWQARREADAAAVAVAGR